VEDCDEEKVKWRRQNNHRVNFSRNNIHGGVTSDVESQDIDETSTCTKVGVGMTLSIVSINVGVG